MQSSKEEYARKRIHNGSLVQIENSFTRVTVWHHLASFVIPKSYPCDRNFNQHLTTIKDFYILCHDDSVRQHCKGPGSVRGIFGCRFSENSVFLTFVVYIYMIKAICHSYQNYAQLSVCMLTVAMETLTNKMKVPFLTIFYIFFCCIWSFWLRFQCRTTRGPTPYFCFNLSHMYSLFMKSSKLVLGWCDI